jgi:hypothetical protein
MTHSTTLRRTATAGTRAGLVVAAGLLLASAGASATTVRSGAPLDPARFSATVDHPLVPLAHVRHTVFTGTERSEESDGTRVAVRGDARVLGRASRGDFVDGELVERTRDYYAQRDDGSVWFLGEQVDDVEGGKVVGHEGQWRAGQGTAKAGLFMPATPRLGAVFQPERAPGVAEDRTKVMAVGLRVRTPAGSFTRCIRTRNDSPTEGATEFDTYCPAVGLVRQELEGGHVDLVRYG